MPILHLQVACYGRHGDDLTIVTFGCLIDLVAIVHRVGRDVLERRLQLATDHNVLLDELHVTAIFLSEFFFLTDRDGIVCIVSRLLVSVVID